MDLWSLSLCRIKIAQASLALCLQLLGGWGGLLVAVPRHLGSPVHTRSADVGSFWKPTPCVVHHGSIGPTPSRSAVWAQGRLHTKKNLLSQQPNKPCSLLPPLLSGRGSFVRRAKNRGSKWRCAWQSPTGLLPARLSSGAKIVTLDLNLICLRTCLLAIPAGGLGPLLACPPPEVRAALCPARPT